MGILGIRKSKVLTVFLSRMVSARRRIGLPAGVKIKIEESRLQFGKIGEILRLTSVIHPVQLPSFT